MWLWAPAAFASAFSAGSSTPSRRGDARSPGGCFAAPRSAAARWVYRRSNSPSPPKNLVVGGTFSSGNDLRRRPRYSCLVAWPPSREGRPSTRFWRRVPQADPFCAPRMNPLSEYMQFGRTQSQNRDAVTIYHKRFSETRSIELKKVLERCAADYMFRVPSVSGLLKSTPTSYLKEAGARFFLRRFLRKNFWRNLRKKTCREAVNSHRLPSLRLNVFEKRRHGERRRQRCSVLSAKKFRKIKTLPEKY